MVEFSDISICTHAWKFVQSCDNVVSRADFLLQGLRQEVITTTVVMVLTSNAFIVSLNTTHSTLPVVLIAIFTEGNIRPMVLEYSLMQHTTKTYHVHSAMYLAQPPWWFHPEEAVHKGGTKNMKVGLHFLATFGSTYSQIVCPKDFPCNKSPKSLCNRVITFYFRIFNGSTPYKQTSIHLWMRWWEPRVHCRTAS